jgi:hypothetical protein
MLTNYTEVVALFTRAKNEKLKGFATKMLPLIWGHLDQAKKLNKRQRPGW